MNPLAQLSRLERAERRPVLGASLTLFGFMVGHALLETARDALFLGALSARQLPWVYLAIAAGAFAMGRVQDRFPPRFVERDELRSLLLAAAGVTTGFWLVTGRAGSWPLYGLYVWSGVLSTLLVVRFWTVAGARFTVTQAKRVFPLIGAAGVAGAIAGSAAARLIAEAAVARHLVLAAAAAFLATSAATRLTRPPGEAQDAREPAVASGRDLSQVLHLISRRPYLRRVAVLILLATLTFTLVDYVFKSAVDRRVPVAGMEEFFSTVYLGLNVLSVVVQLAVVPFLLRRAGSTGAHALVPLTLGVGALGVALLGGLVPVLLLKASDGGLRHSLHRTTTELLFVPVTGELRARAKAFIDVLGQRGGQAFASLLILAVLGASGRERVFALLIVACASVWAWLALGLRRHYVDVFRETLRRDVTATRVEFPSLDAASVASLVRTLSAPDDRKVRAALDVLADQGRARTVPSMILFHPSSAVVLRALERFWESGRRDHLPLARRLEGHPDPRVRAAALRSSGPDPERLRAHLRDPSSLVQATALVGLVRLGEAEDREAQPRLRELLASGDEAAQLALAMAMRSQPHPAFEGALLQLSASPHPSVRLEAVRAMRAATSAAFVPRLVEMLAERQLRDEVREALVAAGPSALERLAATLADPTRPSRVRRHVPSAIALFRSRDAATELSRALEVEGDGLVRFSILRALGRLGTGPGGLALESAPLSRSLERTLADARLLMRWRHALEDPAAGHPVTPARELLVALLRQKQVHAVERAFRLLDLLHPGEDLQRVHRGLESESPALRATSRELIEGLTADATREPLLALIDDLYDTGSGHGAREPQPKVDDVETLRRLLLDAGESLAAVAAFHVGELGLRELVPELSRLASRASPALAEVVGQALAATAGERGGR